MQTHDAMIEAIHATALETIKHTKKPHKRLRHIDAAQPLIHSAEFLLQAAALIANGATLDDPEVKRFIGYSQRKTLQAIHLPKKFRAFPR